MLDRLIPTEVFRGHWKSLSDYRHDPPRPDKVTRIVLVGASLTVAALLLIVDSAAINAPGALLSGLVLFAGSLLAAFGQISTMRTKITDATNDEGLMLEEFDRVPSAEFKMQRNFLDETAAHLLVASYLSAIGAAVLVVSMVLEGQSEVLAGLPAAIVGGVATYVFIVFLIALPRLYVAYVSMHKVARNLSGTHRGR